MPASANVGTGATRGRRTATIGIGSELPWAHERGRIAPGRRAVLLGRWVDDERISGERYVERDLAHFDNEERCSNGTCL